MDNNKKILSFLKQNLKTDLNDNYNELGCASLVNNVLKQTLGYVAGGGPSTAKMLEVLVGNPNFKEVTRNEARAGDIILSATGTGNGKIAHGHVGFLGEKGVIYSNNSQKDMLDDHLTAQDWKNYFVLKGGFSVRYFRAVGEPTIEWKPASTVPTILQSSQNPAKLSMTIKSLVPLIVSILAVYNITIPEQDITEILTQGVVIITMISSLVGVILGVYRKIK